MYFARLLVSSHVVYHEAEHMTRLFNGILLRLDEALFGTSTSPQHKFLAYAVGAFFVLLMAGCGGSGKKAAVKGRSQGAPYELLVVADKEWLKTPAGQTLTDVVEGPIEGLPQYEPQFRCTKINRTGFNGTFKVYRNIVIAEVSRKYAEAEMRIARDEYCRPQLIVYLTAPDDGAFAEMMQTRQEQLLDLFNEQELSRERAVLQKKYSGVVKKQAERQFGAVFLAPQDIDEVKQGRDFFWASAAQQDFRLNVCMYRLPLRDLSLDEFVALRDSVMRVNIPGGREGQWMETDSRTVSFRQRPTADGKGMVTVVRGLWDMRGDAMGGPFVAYLLTDEKAGCLLVAEGFAFAPNEKKRPLIRELEAALQSVSF